MLRSDKRETQTIAGEREPRCRWTSARLFSSAMRIPWRESWSIRAARELPPSLDQRGGLVDEIRANARPATQV